MTLHIHSSKFRQGRQTWVIIGLLSLVILIPTICLLWFVTEAVRNEHMAVRQKLIDSYHSQLVNLQIEIQTFWDQKVFELSRIDNIQNPGERFYNLIETGITDSVIIFDTDEQLVYPFNAEPPRISDSEFTNKWEQAEQLEFKMADCSGADKLYTEIAEHSSNIHIAGRALQARVRCLLKTGKIPEAIDIINEVLSNPKYNAASDQHGRLIIPDAQLLALQLMKEADRSKYQILLDSLIMRIKDYSQPAIPPSQRMFLMKELLRIDTTIVFPSLNAEALAMAYLHLQTIKSITDDLIQVPELDLWQMASTDNTILALFKHNRVLKETREFIDLKTRFTNARVTFVPKDLKQEIETLLSISAGKYFPDWNLNVHIEGDDFYTVASKRQISVYIWTAILIIIGISILTVFGARLLLRQMKLTRIKNDIIATVTHELKTPLASTRVLIDTLNDGKYQDSKVVKDYIELIAKENRRLSRLIDNFLTFSRIENKKQVFNFQEIEPGGIVKSVTGTVRHRFESGGFSLKTEIQENLPVITADYDSLIMVLLNLLDNAFQYSDNVKEVVVRASSNNGYVSYEVSDKGVGLSQREIKKILDPFYQVDRTLSRKSGGVGLGLSIVKSIVESHNGKVEISSEKEKGSVFTVKIPVQSQGRVN